MTEEVLSLLNPQENLTYVDATFGAGGHSKSILESSKSCNVIAIDRDKSVQPFADELHKQYSSRFNFIEAKFSDINKVINRPVDGFLFDIGVSSMQIDSPNRGFSFMRDGPLAMTMGQNTISAYDIVNHYSESQLAEILLKYGDEKAAPKIAKAICNYRRSLTINSTIQLANIVESVVHKRGKIHPATLTFQAIRVLVNNELYELETGLTSALEQVSIGGRVVVITFQGLEDKIVKDIFKRYTYREHQNKFKNNILLTEKAFDNIMKGTLKPSRQEIKRNPRARSAKIRAIIRIT